MAGKKHSSLDKVLGRLDQLDEANLHNLVQRLVRERAMLEAVFNTLQEYKDIPLTSMPYGQAMALLALGEFMHRFI